MAGLEWYNCFNRGISTPVVCPALGGEKQGVMFYTYVLRNSLTGRHYIGSTSNIIRRIAQHNGGKTKSTRQKGIWEVIYREEFQTCIDARRRERKIKSYKGGNAFKQLIAGLVHR